MKHVYKHAFVMVLVGFLLVSPAVAATVFSGDYSPAQELDINDLLGTLIEDGAELVFANIDEEGAPQVIYGQLGIPSEDLGFTSGGVLSDMYTGCVIMVLVATYGEMLEYIFELIGEMSGSNETDGFLPLQVGGFDFNTIMDLIGDEFNLLLNVFLDLDEATSRSRMTSIKTHLGNNFGFTFSELFYLRIDESFFPPDMEFELPFDSIDVFINQVTNVDVVSAIFDVMDTSGFGGAIDQTIFSDAPAAAAGLIAIPDMEALMNAIGGFMGGSSIAVEPFDFILSQEFVFDNLTQLLDGPLALAAVGYIGDQLLSTSSTELNIFEDLLGVTTNVDPLDSGLSMVIANLPHNINVTSYSPENQALNKSFFDEAENLIFWNATFFGSVSDYTIEFIADDLPPMVTIERSFSPTTCSVGGSTQVTVTVTNDGEDPIANVTLTDDGFNVLYPDVAVTGTQTGSWTTLAPGASQSFTYTVTFTNEGVYTFPKAQMTYDFNENNFHKDTTEDGYEVTPDALGLIQQAIADGWPYTGAIIGLVAVVGIYSVMGLIRGGGGGSEFYQT